MKNMRNCNPPYPMYPMMGMPMPNMGPSISFDNNQNDQLNNLEQRINLLEQRINSLENIYNSNYNSNNYQML